MKTYIVGRGDSADIKLDDPSVSREHMSITNQNGRWHVRDLQSNNGTHILNSQGSSEISEEILEGSEELLLGSCRVRLSELTDRVPLWEERQETPVDNGSARTQDSTFSRYIRSEDGRYVRKNK